jgi:membrane carboxypeptidase/penicillin-binding protein
MVLISEFGEERRCQLLALIKCQDLIDTVCGETVVFYKHGGVDTILRAIKMSVKPWGITPLPASSQNFYHSR